jgi:hypothetical protein
MTSVGSARSRFDAFSGETMNAVGSGHRQFPAGRVFQAGEPAKVGA